MDLSPLIAFFRTENKIDIILYALHSKRAITLQIYGCKFKIENVPLFYTLSVLYNIFEKKIYNNLEVRGKIVIDVGGYLGDAAVYFAKCGAKRVYSIEAYPELAGLIKENAKLNGVKITVINRTISPARRVSISRNVTTPGIITWGNRSVRGMKLEDLPKADVLKINVDTRTDPYIRKRFSMLRSRYKQIYWKSHHASRSDDPQKAHSNIVTS